MKLNRINSKKVIIAICIILAIICAISVYLAFTTNKMYFDIAYASKIAASDNIEASIDVKDKKTEESIKATLKVELFNKNHKKVKDIKGKYEKDEYEFANISIPTSENLKDGSYTLRFTAKSGLKKDYVEKNITISNAQKSNVIISLDKGIYKPGDTVNYRALIINKKDNTPSKEKVSVTILDGNGNRVYSQDTDSTEYGIVSGSFTLADEVNSGNYEISVSTSKATVSKEFTVNPYVTPQFAVEVNSDSTSCKVGEKAKITIDAKYFFGEPVVNGTVTANIDGKDIKGITDNDGKYTFEQKIEKVGANNISIKVIDTSNYAIEKSIIVYGKTDAFEIELLPQYGEILKGFKNDVYVYTKNADGTPVKAQLTISTNTGNTKYDNFSKQVITDENGIGKFTITAEETDNLNIISNYTGSSKNYYEKKFEFRVFANDANSNLVQKDIEMKFSDTKNTIISTENVIYEQGDDIDIEVHSKEGLSDKIVSISKNGNVIKLIREEENEFKVNLDDIYGLVDIDVYDFSNNYKYYTNSMYDGAYYLGNTSSKKTIYIKPKAALNLEVKLDKEEYTPGENLNLNITSKDENNNLVDSNLLISILDEAVLALAENDLSIDNIKLALSDITLADGVSAADLYAEVLENKSPNKLMLCLLKQETAPANVTSAKHSTAEYANYTEIATIAGIALIAIIILYFAQKHNALKMTIITIVNILTLLFLVVYSVDDIYYNSTFLSESATLILSAIITIIIYVLALYKYAKQIFKTIVLLVIVPFITAFTVDMLDEFIYRVTSCYNTYLVATIIALIPIIAFTIITLLKRTNKFKNNKKLEKIKLIFVELFRVEVVYLICAFISDKFDFYDFWENAILILIIYMLTKLIKFKKPEKLKKIINSKITFKLTGGEAFALLAVVILIIVLIIVNKTPAKKSPYIPDRWGDVGTNWDRPSSGLTQFQTSSEIPDNSKSSTSSIFDGLFNTFSNTIDSTTNDMIEIENSKGNDDALVNETEKTDIVQENVRNVFLESLAFIPDLVTQNGSANTDIKISDNITTWNLQVLGNTKDGRIGHTSTNFKVFKEFFVDFTLPTNSVVTDKVSIPVTVYNYKDTSLDINLKVAEASWMKLGEYESSISLSPNSTKMIYVPIEILTSGSNKLKISATANNLEDIVEKSIKVSENGIKVDKVISSGTIDESLDLDYFSTNKAIEGTRKINVKLYSSIMSQVVENMESILKMPSGCFEQTSSSLYPDILVLNYLEENHLDNEEIKAKALDYIEKGYQKLLTYEVSSSKGGFSLYGKAPAENVLTAFGLMEFTDLAKVYNTDSAVTERMIDYLFAKQKINGSFDFKSTYIGNPASTSDLAMNAYIIWALSEACPDDSRLEKSVKYLEDNFDDMKDGYEIALAANVFANTNSSYKTKAINKLLKKVVESTENNSAYIKTTSTDYWGSKGRYQNLQATALTSLVLTKTKTNNSVNSKLIKYIISQKDVNGSWNTTQATILSLKALVLASENSKLEEQTIKITVNGEVKEISMGGKDSMLDIYEAKFYKVADEGKISIEMKSGSLYYEIVEEEYVSYSDYKLDETEIKVNQSITQEANVNDILKQNIVFQLSGEDIISNGLVQITIPQGCTVREESLAKLVSKNLIEKYEYSYSTINLYLRKISTGNTYSLDIEYNAKYPESITGGTVRVYDYYNPDIDGISMPVNINIK